MVDRIGISKLINWTVWHRMERARERWRAFDERERQWIYGCVFHLWPIHFRLKACSVSNKIHQTATFLSMFHTSTHRLLVFAVCSLAKQHEIIEIYTLVQYVFSMIITKFLFFYCRQRQPLIHPDDSIFSDVVCFPPSTHTHNTHAPPVCSNFTSKIYVVAAAFAR